MKRLNVAKWKELLRLEKKSTEEQWKMLSEGRILSWEIADAYRPFAMLLSESAHNQQQAKLTIDRWRKDIEKNEEVKKLQAKFRELGEPSALPTYSWMNKGRGIYKPLIASYDAGKLDVVGIAESVMWHHEADAERNLLRNVYSWKEAKRGRWDLMTFFYILRAHFRNKPRIHVKGMALERQAEIVEKVLKLCPTLFGQMVYDPAAALPAAPDPELPSSQVHKPGFAERCVHAARDFLGLRSTS